MDSGKENDFGSIFTAKGLVVVITGGGTGLGLDMATAAFRTGAKKVFILGRRLDVLERAARSLDEGMTAVIPIQCDVSSPESVAAAARRVEQDAGHVDVLVNNAGRPDTFVNSYAAATVGDLQRMLLGANADAEDILRLNVSSVIGVSAAFLELLHLGNVRRGWPAAKLEDPNALNARARPREPVPDVDDDDLRTSQIITISSLAGIEMRGAIGLAYSASKAAATHLGHMFSMMFSPWNIRSNVVAPGWYHSEATAVVPFINQIPYGNTPAGRAGRSTDVAGFFLYLVGKSGAFVNGDVILTDGGRHHRAQPDVTFQGIPVGSW